MVFDSEAERRQVRQGSQELDVPPLRDGEQKPLTGESP